MELIDSTKQVVNNALPRRHQAAIAALVLGLFAIIAITALPPKVEQRPVPMTEHVRIAPVVSVPSTPVAVEDTRTFLEVSSGDNLSTLFNDAGFGAQEVVAITESTSDIASLTDLHPGDQLAFEIADDKRLLSFEVVKSPLESFIFKRNVNGAYDYQHVRHQPEVQQVYKEAVITDSLFLAAQRSNIPDSFALDLASIFGGVVDFIMDTREGDSFNLLYEEHFLDGEFIGYGRILAAEFVNQGRTHTALRYDSVDGTSNFYNPEGESMHKTFLLNPVDFTRISSGFSLARRHPILNTIRAHKGTDYAAPKGTKVVATADGRVTFVGRSGSYGKLIVLQHGERFETKYAHLNGYAKGIKEGTQVRQNDVIGYVGATGSATGPHLHYELLMDGTHRNSQTIFDQLPRAQSIAEAEMPRFRQQTGIFVALLASKGVPTATLARNAVANNSQE
jgi:murein DD-endopeptidase MepM/ murein hydrolase activator NlpD